MPKQGQIKPEFYEQLTKVQVNLLRFYQVKFTLNLKTASMNYWKTSMPKICIPMNKEDIKSNNKKSKSKLMVEELNAILNDAYIHVI